MEWRKDIARRAGRAEGWRGWRPGMIACDVGEAEVPGVVAPRRVRIQEDGSARGINCVYHRAGFVESPDLDGEWVPDMSDDGTAFAILCDASFYRPLTSLSDALLFVAVDMRKNGVGLAEAVVRLLESRP